MDKVGYIISDRFLHADPKYNLQYKQMVHKLMTVIWLNTSSRDHVAIQLTLIEGFIWHMVIVGENNWCYT